MNILILGGTKFIGRHIVEALVVRGHNVTTFNRGESPDTLPTTVERLRGNRDDGDAALAALRGRTWDACVDVSGYTPLQVRATAEALRDTVAHYVYVSAVSVYGDPATAPVTENYPLLPPADEGITTVNGETYGPLKVACERVVEEIFSQRNTLVRPQVVVGTYDDSNRLTSWLARAQRSGAGTPLMLAPGDGSDYLQVIDAADVANFVCTAIEKAHLGTFNLAGARITWDEFMQLIGAKNMVWVSAEILREAKLTFNDLPLYRAQGGARSSLMNVSSAAAQAAGLKLTPSAQTIAHARAWMRVEAFAPAMSVEREAALVAQMLGSISARH